MELFEIRDGSVFPTTHALMISPFNEIWESDPDPNKGNATKVFRYIELVCSPKKSNPFFGYSEEERPAKVKKEIYGDENRATTDYMLRGVIKYKQLLEHHSPTYSMLISGLNAKKALEDYLNNFDMSERTQSGAMVLKPQDIAKTIAELPESAKSIEIMIAKVGEELKDEAKTRKDREIGEYER